MNKTLKVGLPKGSLQETTLKLLKKAGWNFNLSSRAYKPYWEDNELEAWLIRAQEMSIYVEQGVFDYLSLNIFNFFKKLDTKNVIGLLFKTRCIKDLVQ